MSKPNYQPGQKIILFDKEIPYLAWVAEGYGYGCVDWTDTHWEILTTPEPDDLKYGRHVNSSKVKPFTPELWAACQAWIARREQLAVDLVALKRQRLPQVKTKAPWQDLLVSIDC